MPPAKSVPPKVQMMKVVDLPEPDPTNPNTHPDPQVGKLIQSIEYFGWTQPIILSSDWKKVKKVAAGEGRIVAAIRQGLEEIPVIVMPWTFAEKGRAYRIADNEIPLQSQWDPEILAGELRALADEERLMTGFDADDLDAMLGEPEPKVPPSGGDPGDFLLVQFKLPRDEYAKLQSSIDKFAQTIGHVPYVQEV